MWRYWRIGEVELASCAGSALPDLRLHFHETAQLCLVQNGKRRAETRYGTVEVVAGECLYLPASLPHRFTGRSAAAAQCLNIYIPLDLGVYPCRFPAGDIRLLLQSSGPSRSVSSLSGTLPAEGDPLPVGVLARDAGVSREHFSRTFAQEHGLPPHRYRIVHRLNGARQAIARGNSLADVAAQYDFADQSHLGRLFRQTFGTTPGAYRKGCI